MENNAQKYPFGTRPTRLAVIGAGNRATKYAEYARLYPERLQLVAVVEINGLRRRHLARAFGVAEERCFASHEAFFAAQIEADMVLIATPDHLHFEPTIKAIQAGYHILLEKPIAQRLEECKEIARQAKEHGVRVSICHVLRYHPYFQKIHDLVHSGKLGKLVSMHHTVCVGLDRGTHSYVRGVFRREADSSPMLLAKCCHDVDFMVWLTDQPCKRISSFGSLRWFRPENAPEGSAERCVNCSVEATCPFSACDLYRTRRDWISNFDVEDGESLSEAIERELQEGMHGRCVYHCDNDVVDRQTATMEMADGSVFNLMIDLFTRDDDRKTTILLTDGEIVGDENHLRVRYFRPEREEVFDFSEVNNTPFHAGADLRTVEEFLLAIHNPEHPLLTDIEVSIESHHICYAAEESRHKGQVVTL